MKIILIQFLAANAFYMERGMLNNTAPLDTTTIFETTTEVPCDWPWAKRHAFAIGGFIFGFLFRLGAKICSSVMYVIIIVCFFGIFGFIGLIIDHQIYKKHCT